jgi:Ni,Fe-hydrogenase III large subunit
MSLLAPLLATGVTSPVHAPWPRATIDADTWRRLALHLAGGELTLLSLWGEPAGVHLAVAAEETREIAVFTFPCPGGAFPSIGLSHPPAIRLERTIADLYGLRPDGAEDTRPWLDHGAWGLSTPLGTATPARPHDYDYLPVRGDNLHEIPVGPVHAGIIEPGHFRFTADGETVVRLEQRLGYTHKGTDSLLAGAPLERAARLAGRVSGDATVAYATAFARAVEAATGAEAPSRGVWLRALMGELERIANHVGDFGAICNDASFAIMLAHCSALRERSLRAAETAFGHRLMMDRVVPGGTVSDISAEGVAAIGALLPDFARRLERLVELYDSMASLLDRTVTTGMVKAEYVRQFGAGGFVGRASGRDFDSRRWPGYAPFESLRFDVPVLEEGDVNARVWIRIHEMRASINLCRQLLDGLPSGPHRVEVPDRAGEGMALAESFRGDVLAWLRLGPGGIVERCHLRDPSWFQWPLLEVAVDRNIVADFPLCNKSFNCSYSGHDL